MYDFEVRQAKPSILSKLRAAFSGEEPISFEVVVPKPKTMVSFGRMPEGLLAKTFFGAHVISEKDALAGNIGRLKFSSDTEKESFIQNIGAEVLKAQGKSVSRPAIT